MIVSWSNFKEIVEKLSIPGERSLDTETSGLRVFHGDALFSIIIGEADQEFYFNFIAYPEIRELMDMPDGNGGTYKDEVVVQEELAEEFVLDRSFLELMKPIFAQAASTWFIHNAKYDMHILANDGIEIAGTIHCTRAIALVEYNEHFKYDLGSCAERIGLQKDDKVEAYIKEHKLSRKEPVPGKKTRATIKDFSRVPFPIITEYGCTDAKVGRRLGVHQSETIHKIALETPSNIPKLTNVFENERRLTKTCWRMERVGLQLDLTYCKEAKDYEYERSEKLSAEFKALTGDAYSASPKLFARVFESDKPRWAYTDKGNPSFESDTIKTFESPAAKLVVALRDAKSKSDFYNGFLYHADKNGRIHPTLNQDGAGHGRFSSSEPNMQNLKKNKEKELAEEKYVVRRAIVPTPGYFLVAIDKKQMEYRLLLDVAGEMGLIKKIINEGLDVHTATGNEAHITRDQAKTVNFGLIYGQGNGLLASSLGVNLARAREIRETVLGIMPKVAEYNWGIARTAQARGFIFNWYGRRCYFPFKHFAYRALNYAIAGGCADIMKIGMNRIDEYLLDKKSRMIWNVHDENLLEVWPGEEYVIAEVVRLMETSYPHRFLPMECDVEWSDKSWADLKAWEGVAHEAR